MLRISNFLKIRVETILQESPKFTWEFSCKLRIYLFIYIINNFDYNNIFSLK